MDSEGLDATSSDTGPAARVPLQPPAQPTRQEEALHPHPQLPQGQQQQQEGDKGLEQQHKPQGQGAVGVEHHGKEREHGPEGLQGDGAPAADHCLSPDDWSCPICMDLMFKPCVNNCGHAFCFWCMHHAMNPFRPSQCPVCRGAYTHFPRVCVPLHRFLEAAFPQQYAERCRENQELEAEQGAESPAIGPDGDASAHVAAALTALALRTAAAGRPGEGVAGDDGGDGGDGEGFAMEAEAGPAFRCSRAGCGRLAVPPCVLSCGCLVCSSTCRPSFPSATSAGGVAAGGSGGGAGGRAMPCPTCSKACLPGAGVCRQLEEAVRQLYPQQCRVRERGVATELAEAAAAAAAAAAASAASQAAQEAGTTDAAAGDLQGSTPGGADGGTAVEGGRGGSTRRPASKLPAIDALLARYASQQRESRRYGGRAAAAANPVGAADGGGGPPGELTSAAIWAATRRELAAHEDSVFTWYSVGCDDCGVFPIVGRRYRCRDCPEAIGYDLCGPCYDRGAAGRGRFNQAHRPEHVLEKVDTGLARWRPQQQQEQQQQQQEQEQPGPQGSESAQAAPGAQHEGTSPAPAGQGSIGADAAASDGTAAGGTAGGLGHARDEANRAQTDEPMDSNQVLILLNCLEALHPELTVEQATQLALLQLGVGAFDLMDWALGGSAGAGGAGAQGAGMGQAAGRQGAGQQQGAEQQGTRTGGQQGAGRQLGAEGPGAGQQQGAGRAQEQGREEDQGLVQGGQRAAGQHLQEAGRQGQRGSVEGARGEAAERGRGGAEAGQGVGARRSCCVQ